MNTLVLVSWNFWLLGKYQTRLLWAKPECFSLGSLWRRYNVSFYLERSVVDGRTSTNKLLFPHGVNAFADGHPSELIFWSKNIGQLL